MSLTNTNPVQYAWGNDNIYTLDEYEILIDLVHNKIKEDYKDDETCRAYSKLLGKLLVNSNQ